MTAFTIFTRIASVCVGACGRKWPTVSNPRNTPCLAIFLCSSACGSSRISDKCPTQSCLGFTFSDSKISSCSSAHDGQLKIFESEKVNPKQLCVGHLSEILDDPQAELHKRIAKRGVYLGFDTVGHFLPHAPTQTDAMRVKMVKAVIDAGYEDQVLLSSDLGRVQDLKSNWGAGYSTVGTVFVPKLRYAGVKEETIHKILVDNPRRFLAF